MGWKKTIKEYGIFFFIYWTAIWACSGVIIFLLLEYGLIGGADAISFLKWIRLDSIISLVSIDPTVGNIAVAIAINECLEIVRFPFAVSSFVILKQVFGGNRN
ncbi:MAG: hypothetical protein MK159_02405 [Halobacteriales archaeon]|nr:hypothetical protein [Halobacteriales archaeon]